MDNRDRFHEANILLSNTLRQLDEVMSKGECGRVVSLLIQLVGVALDFNSMKFIQNS
jgi:hypothetical protein